MSDVEDEGRPLPARVKEVGTTTVACPMLSSVLSLKTVGFEDVVGCLKAYEERVSGNDGVDEQQVMFTRLRGGGPGARSSNDNGASGDGVSGSLSREMKQKWGRFNNQGEVINKDGRSTGDGRNTGGGAGGDDYDGSGGFSGTGDWLKEIKGKWGINNRGDDIINKDGSGSGYSSDVGSGSGGSGSKAQSANKPNKSKPNNQPNCISEKQETIGSNQVQGNAELDRNHRHL